MIITFLLDISLYGAACNHYMANLATYDAAAQRVRRADEANVSFLYLLLEIKRKRQEAHQRYRPDSIVLQWIIEIRHICQII